MATCSQGLCEATHREGEGAPVPLPHPETQKLLRQCQLASVNAERGTASPPLFETAPQFGEYAESLAQVQVCMNQVTLHQICTAWRAASPVRIAKVLDALSNERAKREVIVCVGTGERDELQPVQRFGA